MRIRDVTKEYRFDTPLGSLHAVSSAIGLISLRFDDTNCTEEKNNSIHPLLLQVERQVQEYCIGDRQEFDIPLDLRGTEFQRTVWNSLLQIPYGETWSYAEQSRILGRSKAIRAIASANGRNPVAIIVPCHRVIGSDGSLTGYAGGLDLKRKLLLLESPQPRYGLFA